MMGTAHAAGLLTGLTIVVHLSDKSAALSQNLHNFCVFFRKNACTAGNLLKRHREHCIYRMKNRRQEVKS